MRAPTARAQARHGAPLCSDCGTSITMVGIALGLWFSMCMSVLCAHPQFLLRACSLNGALSVVACPGKPTALRPVTAAANSEWEVPGLRLFIRI